MSNLHGRQRAPPSGVTSNFKGLLKGWPQLEPGRAGEIRAFRVTESRDSLLDS